MYNVVHQNSRFCFICSFFCRDKKGLLNFVSERILLVYGINLLGTAFKKKAAFLTSKALNRPHTPELKSISKFQLLFHWKNFEK